jgi:hypothetical protein
VKYKYGLLDGTFDGNPTKESDFEERIANILEMSYFHKVSRQVRYRGKDGNGRLDLHLETNPAWEHHETFPVLGIELKLSNSLGPIIDVIAQVERYADSRMSGDYGSLPPPNVILFCTPDSWYRGVVYSWRHPKWKECMECPHGNGHIEATELFEKVLMKVGCSLIRSNGWERGFLCNKFGPEKWYGLGRVA